MPDGSTPARIPLDITITRFFAAARRGWPWSARRLVLLLRISASLGTTLALVLAWRLIAALPSAVAGVIAIVACLAFAYWFERGDAA